MVRFSSYRFPCALLVAATVALAFCALTRDQIRYWRDSEPLFRHALLVTRNNHLAHAQLGAALEKQGKLDDAITEFKEDLNEKPNFPEAHNNLGIVLDKQSRF